MSKRDNQTGGSRPKFLVVDKAASKETGIDWGHCRVVQGGGGAEIHPGAAPAASEQAFTAQAANDLSQDLLGRLIVDEDEPFMVVDPEGHILLANDRYREIAEGSGGVLPEFEGSGSAGTTSEFREIAAEVRSTRRPIRSEDRVVIDGEARFFQISYLPVQNEDNDVVAVAVSFRDVTATRTQLHVVSDAQQRFKDFARATSDWFWEVDRNFCIRAISDRFTALTGRPGALLLGQRLEDVGTFKPNIDGDSSAAEAFRRRSSFRDQLIEVETEEGENLRFHLSGVPVFESGSGDFLGYRGAGQDVTARYDQEIESRRIRANLERTLEELKVKNRQLDLASSQAETALIAKNEFLAAMSHELRTPLNAIIGFAEAMTLKVSGDLSDNYLSYAQNIVRAGRHLLGLIDDVLDVAVIESGEMNLSPTLLSLKEVLEQAATLCRKRAEDAKIDVSGLDIDEDIDVYADERRATQIFVNLLTNAIKFTPPGGKIGYDIAPGDENKIDITVWDTGIGISEDKQKLIFDKFQQVEEHVYSRRTEGTGLGLHISRELARRMGGDIAVSSRPGEGSRFTVSLPRAG